MLFLTYIEAGLPNLQYLREGDTLIGRSATCDVVINSPHISRQHARVRVVGEKVTVQDLGSTSGTFLHDSRLTGERELKTGESFYIAEIMITLGGDVPQVDLIEEGHQLVDESHVVMSVVPADTAVDDEGHQLVDEAHSIVMSVVPPAAAVESAPAGAPATERRKGPDRRKQNIGRPAGDRRVNRDRRGGRILKLLTEISNTLVQVQPLEQVLDRVVQLVFDVVPAERGFLLLRDSIDQPLTARVQRTRDGAAPTKTTLSRTIVNKVMRERVAMLARDAVYDARLNTSNSIHLMNVRSFMCAPLWNRDEVIGVLYCDSPKSKIFQEGDLEVFAALSNYAAVAIEQSRLMEQLTEETRRRERLQRYHSPGVTNKILHGGADDDGLVAQTRDVSIMFCDMVGFTTLTQHMSPDEVGAMLNEFFERMTDVIFDHEGTLDKFIGDAILAVFGAPLEQDDHATRAVTAALGMRQALERLNAERPERPIRMRMAINSGQALTGDIGSPRRREFTVLGDVVNTASRIESSVAKPGQIVISKFTKDLLGPGYNLRQLESVTLRGRDSALDLFEVLD